MAGIFLRVVQLRFGRNRSVRETETRSATTEDPHAWGEALNFAPDLGAILEFGTALGSATAIRDTKAGASPNGSVEHRETTGIMECKADTFPRSARLAIE